MLFVSVCSAYFDKCYILLENHDTELSWSMVEVNICRKYNWTLVSLHTRQEQDFLGQLLINKLRSVANEDTYIGKQYQVFIIKLF